MSSFKRYVSFFLLMNLVLLSPTYASQIPSFDTKFLFEGMDYKKLYKSNVMAEPRFKEVLSKEGLLRDVSKAADSSANKNNDDDDNDAGVSENLELPVLGAEHSRSDTVISVAQGQSLTSQDLDDALSKEFREKKRRAMIRSLGRPLLMLLSDLSILSSGTATLSNFNNNGLGFGLGIAVWVIIEKFLFNTNIAVQTAWYLWLTPIGDPLQDLEDKYAQKKRFFSAQMQERVERLFQDARKDDTTGSKKEQLDRILKIPVKSKRPKFDRDGIANLLKGYKDSKGESITESVMLAAVNHMARFTERAGHNPSPNMILYFQSKPGLGKTRMIRELLKLMGLPLIELQLNDERFKSTATEPGTFLQGITSVDYRNCGLFLDEFDRVANSDDESKLNMLLPFLDPSAETMFDAYIGETLGISHFFRIAAGNSLPKDKALLDRCIVIDIQEVERSIKIKGIHQDMLPLLLKSADPQLDLDLKSLSENARQAIESAIANDNEPGFRGVQKSLQILINRERLKKMQ